MNMELNDIKKQFKYKMILVQALLAIFFMSASYITNYYVKKQNAGQIARIVSRMVKKGDHREAIYTLGWEVLVANNNSPVNISDITVADRLGVYSSEGREGVSLRSLSEVQGEVIVQYSKSLAIEGTNLEDVTINVSKLSLISGSVRNGSLIAAFDSKSALSGLDLNGFIVSLSGGTLSSGLKMYNGASLQNNGNTMLNIGEDVTIDGAFVSGGASLKNGVLIRGVKDENDQYSATVSGDVSIGRDSEIVNSQVYGSSVLAGEVLVYDSSIGGSANISDGAIVRNNSFVGGHAVVRGLGAIIDSSRVYGNAVVSDGTKVLNGSEVRGDSYLESFITVSNSEFWGEAHISVNKSNVECDGDFDDDEEDPCVAGKE